MNLNNFDFKLIYNNKGTDFVIKSNDGYIKNRYFEFLISNKLFDDVHQDLLDVSYNGFFQTFFQKLVSNGGDISEKKYSNLIDELIKIGSCNFMIAYLIQHGKEIPEKIKNVLLESYNKSNDIYVIFTILFKYNENITLGEIPKFILDYILDDIITQTKILSFFLSNSSNYISVQKNQFIDFFLKDFIKTYDNFIDIELKKEKIKGSDYDAFYSFKIITLNLYENNSNNKVFLDFINSKNFKEYFKLYNNFLKKTEITYRGIKYPSTIIDKEFVKIINHLLKLNESFKSFFYK